MRPLREGKTRYFYKKRKEYTRINYEQNRVLLKVEQVSS